MLSIRDFHIFHWKPRRAIWLMEYFHHAYSRLRPFQAWRMADLLLILKWSMSFSKNLIYLASSQYWELPWVVVELACYQINKWNMMTALLIWCKPIYYLQQRAEECVLKINKNLSCSKDRLVLNWLMLLDIAPFLQWIFLMQTQRFCIMETILLLV